MYKLEEYLFYFYLFRDFHPAHKNKNKQKRQAKTKQKI